LTPQQIADASGVPLSTVSRLLSGQTDNPTFQNVADVVKAIVKLYERSLEHKNRWIKNLFILCGSLIGFVILVLLIDIINGSFGFIRY